MVGVIKSTEPSSPPSPHSEHTHYLWLHTPEVCVLNYKLHILFSDLRDSYTGILRIRHLCRLICAKLSVKFRVLLRTLHEHFGSNVVGSSSVRLTAAEVGHKSTVVSLSVHCLEEAGWQRELKQSVHPSSSMMHAAQVVAPNGAFTWFNNSCSSYRYWWGHFKSITGALLIRRDQLKSPATQQCSLGPARITPSSWLLLR